MRPETQDPEQHWSAGLALPSGTENFHHLEDAGQTDPPLLREPGP
jgi:hypothetical protein